MLVLYSPHCTYDVIFTATLKKVEFKYVVAVAIINFRHDFYPLIDYSLRRFQFRDIKFVVGTPRWAAVFLNKTATME